MNVLLRKLSRETILTLLFFLPQARRIRIERWLRGRDDLKTLGRADCVVVSYGKSGRTWLRVLMSRFYQIRHGLSERHLISFDNLYRKDSRIPKIFFTHDNYLKDYTGHDRDKSDYYDKKVILLVRHPADVAVSQYFQWKYRMRAAKKTLNQYPPDGAEIEIFDFVMRPESGLPSVIDYMNIWANEAEKIKSLHLLRYEDLRADTAGALEGALAFMGTPATPEELEQSVAFASVENMRKLEERKVFWLSGGRMVAKDKGNPNSYKVRRAKVGGFKDYFDDAQVAEIEAMINSRLSPYFGYGDAAAGPIDSQSRAASA